MSNYWKKKLDELEKETKAPSVTSTTSYWEKKMDELKNEKKTTVTLPTMKKEKDNDFISTVKRDDEDDIAPVKSKKEESRLDFFQKGVFDDGYQFGDITKTILGTAGDAGLNVVKGIAGLGEGIGDLVSYGIAGVADLAGKDEYAAGVRKRASVNLVDKFSKGAEDYLNQYSILGRTSDAVMQGVGQVGGIIATGGIGSAAGLGAGGVTALTTGTMGLSGMGSGMGEAYQGGATDEEAALYGAISGAADALSELLFGGLGRAINATGFSVGLSSADDLLAKKVSSMFSSHLAKNAAEFGIKAGAEGFEEVIAGTAQAIGKKLTYMSEEDLGKILKDENLLEQFVVGAVTSGIAQAPSLHSANTSKTDFITGQTQNEQAVVKKEIEKRIAEAEKDGKKLTSKEKAKIEAQVEKDMEKGYISTDTIEEVLGGETYQRYKETVDSENALAEQQKALQEEFDTLNKMKQGEMTGEQIDRRTELKEELAKLKETIKSTQNNSNKNQLKQQLSESVSEMVRSDRLIESYNERSRRGQAFEADLSKYDTKQKAVIEKAVNSGILNNTNRTHEFVDMVAKISADKGVLFDFTNNEKLKTSGFAVDGKAVNGYVTKDGITVNIQSSKALNSIVGHEITHVLEGTDLYTELQNAVVEYAKTKGDYQGRYDSLTKLYEGIEGANVDAELTADLVGDYLFTDSDFINNLSVNNRNVFQKIYDEVKYLLKVATAGSKEARELEKVKRAFDKAYREGGKAQTDTKYALTESFTDSNGTRFDNAVLLDTDFFDGTPPRNWGEKLKEKVNERAANDPFILPIVDENGNTTLLQFARPDDRVTKDGASNHKVLDKLSSTSDNISKLAVIHIDEIVSVSEENLPYHTNENNHQWLDKNGWLHRNANVINQKNGNIYNLTVDIAKAADGRTILYATNGKIKKVGNVQVNSLKIKGSGQNSDFDNKVAQDGSNVKYSLSDSNGKQLSGEQQEFFKDSVVRDESGNLKVMYHGTSKGGFSVFNTYGSNYGLFGTGSYFTDSKTIGESYTKKGKGKNPQVYEAYLNIKNPMDMDAAADPAQWAKAFPDADFPESGTNEQFYRAVEEFYADQWMSKWEVAEEIQAGIESGMGYDGITHIGGGRVNPNGERHRVYIAFDSNQIKSVANTQPTGDPDIRRSLSNAEQQKQYGNYNVYGKDIALETAEEIAPVAENATTTEDSTAVGDEMTPTVSETEKVAPVPEPVSEADMFPDEPTPQAELDSLVQEQEALETRMMEMANAGDFSEFESVNARYAEVQSRIAELEDEISESESGRLDSIGDEDVPPEMDAPYYEPSKPEATPDPFMGRDMDKVAKDRKAKAYQYENPEVKPFFMDAALGMMGDLNDTVPGEKFFNGDVYYESGGEKGWMGTKRHTTEDIAWLKDTYGYTYDQIRDGVNAIIEDDGKENNAVSKRIEFLLHERLVNGYTGVWGEPVPPNQEYINFLKEREINEYSREAFDSFMATADQFAPMEEIAPVAAPVAQNVAPAEVAPVKEEYEAITPKRKKEPKMVRADKPFDQKTASVLVEEPKVEKKKNSLWSMVKENVFDNGMVFEDLALKTKNRGLQAKWNFIRYAQSMAQRMVGNGTENVKSLDSIRKEVEKSGKTKEFYEYLYHWLNVDRMTLENRYEDTPNKAVFGDSVTADMSRVIAVQLGKKNPEFRRWAQDVYRYNSHLRTMMVNNGVISQETADLWQAMYPHYVPIRRVDTKGLNIDVPLDTGRTSVNAPIKRATGGNSDILPLFDTMAQRTLQTYKAIAKNSFGVELKNTLGTTVSKEQTDIDGVIDSVDNHEGLLQEGKNGKKPTFTVFENGEKVTFEITDEMYNAMKPASDLMSYTNPVTNTISNFHRGLLTEYNPVFMATNAIKDTQDILINSQHPVRTYANLPRATWQIAKNGKWFREYMENGGEDNTYFDGENNSFDTEEKGVRKLLGIPPLSWISKINNFVERTPRLAEYIASREAGRSIEVSMLDAARVTTNFAAGGKLTKFLNRNGATFLNASLQGVVQQARNFREAKANGLKGWAQLAGKFALAGLPAILLNNLMWDDDDEYEELSDYVKQNYYIVGKYGDGKFVRIPKGRTLAVIQNAFEQMENLITGDDEVDLKSFLELVVSNLAPNNPVEDNILAPIIQVANNETWYGEDLVPTRLQDLPAAEQFDESTDAISKWLGEKLNFSPYKINYLLDQYSGGVGDTFLPMLTPEEESGDNSFLGNVLAPAKSKFTTDSVINNQNVSDFYDVKEELTTNAKSSKATDEDKLMYKYINSVNAELSDLYAQKREIQNSDLSSAEKYDQVRDIQSQIVALTKKGLATYEDISYEGEYARIGDRMYMKNDEGEWQKLSDEQVTKYEVTKAAGDAPYATDGTNHYRWYEPGEDAGEGAEPGWRKVTEKELERQKEVTGGLGISPEEYWGNREEYSYAFDNPENYAVAKAVGGYDSYKQYSADLYDISADKDKYGKSISGSRKAKVQAYIDSLDADYYTKLILYKSEYTSYDDKNYEIIEYLNGRNDISFEEEIAILRKLGFDVTAEGDISW